MERSIMSTRVLIVRDGKLLCLRETMASGERKWGLPGGGVESGEFLWDTATRECVEELGVPVTIGPVKAVIYAVFPDGNQGLRFGMEGELVSDAAFVLEEGTEAFWLTEAEARAVEGRTTPGWPALVDAAFRADAVPVMSWYRDLVPVTPPFSAV